LGRRSGHTGSRWPPIWHRLEVEDLAPTCIRRLPSSRWRVAALRPEKSTAQPPLRMPPECSTTGIPQTSQPHHSSPSSTYMAAKSAEKTRSNDPHQRALLIELPAPLHNATSGSDKGSAMTRARTTRQPWSRPKESIAKLPARS
jgi:hypothetical protein